MTWTEMTRSRLQKLIFPRGIPVKSATDLDEQAPKMSCDYSVSRNALKSFFQDHLSVAATWSHKSNTMVYMDSAREMNHNFKALKGAGYILDNVKVFPSKNSIVACFGHEHPPDDMITGAFGSPADGTSIVVKGECAVCHQTTGKRCGNCRAMFYCSEACKTADAEDHQQWCVAPHLQGDYTLYTMHTF